MRDLSAASGMSLAGMYYYVRGKEDLLALIQERCFARCSRARGRRSRPPPIRRSGLQAFIRHHVSFFTDHMAEMKVLSHETPPRSVGAIKRRYVDLLESILKDAAPTTARWIAVRHLHPVWHDELDLQLVRPSRGNRSRPAGRSHGEHFPRRLRRDSFGG